MEWLGHCDPSNLSADLFGEIDTVLAGDVLEDTFALRNDFGADAVAGDHRDGEGGHGAEDNFSAGWGKAGSQAYGSDWHGAKMKPVKGAEIYGYHHG